MADGEAFLLTAAHVAGSLSWAHGSGRDDVRLAQMSKVPSAGDPKIGRVFLSHPPDPCRDVEIDAALILPEQGVSLGDVVRRQVVSGRHRDVEATALDDSPVIVYKRGIQEPGLTAGYLEPFPVSIGLDQNQPDGSKAARIYPRVFVVVGDGCAFAKPGDSGSVVVDEDECVVGMLVGVRPLDPLSPHVITDETPAYVVSIVDIINELNLELMGPDRPCTAV